MAEAEKAIRSAPFLADAGEDETNVTAISDVNLILQVTKEGGAPLAHARATLLLPRKKKERTDESGLAVFHFSHPCLASIEVSAEGYYPERLHHVLVGHGKERARVSLRKARVVEVRVVGEGLPVANARVVLTPWAFTLGRLPTRGARHKQEAVTSQEGSALFPNVGYGSYFCRATAPGFVAGSTEVEFAKSPERSLVSLELKKGSPLSVRLVDDATGAPIAWHTVLFGTQGGWIDLGGFVTNEAGRVTLFRDPHLECAAHIPASGGYYRVDIHKIPEEVTEWTIPLHAVPECRAWVKDETEASVADAELEISVTDGVKRRKPDMTPEGAYLLPATAVAVGYKLRFRGRTGAVSAWQKIIPFRKTEYEFTIREAAVVAGRVIDPSGDAIEGAQVLAWRVRGLGGGGVGGPRSYAEDQAVVGNDGRFALRLYPLNLYRVRTYTDIGVSRDVLIQVVSPTRSFPLPGGLGIIRILSGTNAQLEPIVVDGFGTVVVHVSVGGAPLGHARVWLVPAEGRAPTMRSLKTAADRRGKAVFLRVLSGDYYCVASRDTVLELGRSLIVRPPVGTKVEVHAGMTTDIQYVR